MDTDITNLGRDRSSEHESLNGENVNRVNTGRASSFTCGQAATGQQNTIERMALFGYDINRIDSRRSRCSTSFGWCDGVVTAGGQTEELIKACAVS